MTSMCLADERRVRALSRVAPGAAIVSTCAFIALVGTLATPRLPAQDLVLAEFLTLNDSSLRDVDGERSDWFEVFNPGPDSVSTEGWSVTDDPSDLAKWVFPSVDIPSGDRLVVFASGKDRRAVDGGGGRFLPRASSEFPHGLEFSADGVLPTEEGAADGWTMDGFNLGAGAEPPALSVGAGVLSFETVLSGQWALINSASWSDEVDPATSYTFETRLRVTASAGSNPGAILWLANGTERVILRVDLEETRTWSGTLLHEGDNTTTFVTFRVAYDADREVYFVWRNGELIGDALGDDGADARRSIFMLDCCSSGQAAGEVDYVRWDATGVFAPPGASTDLPELHTNFRLSSTGEYFALVAPDGRVTTEFTPRYPEQFVDVSYGEEGYFLTPTPGQPNGEAVEGFVEPPEFSVRRGYYDAPFDVTLASATPESEIRYTLDGSKPSPSHGFVASGSVPIATTTALRAIATRPGWGPSPVVTHTYIFLNDVLEQTGAGFPNNSDWDYDVDPNVVNDPRLGTDIIQDFRSLPALSLVLPVEDMFGPNGIHANPTLSGRAWERETSVEWIDPDGRLEFQLNAGVRIQGAGSRFRPLGKKSFRLAFRREYGAGRLRQPVLGPEAADSFDTLVLRGNYFDTWSVHTAGDGETIGWESALLFRDRFAYLSQWATGHHSLRGTWVHLYIDGLYWGVYNVTERPDEEFAASYFGGDAEDYDVLKQRPRGSANGSPPELVSGTRDAWDELIALVKGNIASNAVYAEVSERLELDSFIDYLILNLFGGNQDWPHNNWYAIRDAEDVEPFHFVSWDAENFMFRLAESGKLTTAVDHSPGILYDRLRRNAEFRVRFGDRVHRHFFHAGAFTPEANSARFRGIVEELERAMDPEAARWGDTRIEPPRNRIDQWEVVIADKLTRYFPLRTDIVLSQFRSVDLYPDVDAPVFSQHGGPIGNGFALAVNAAEGEMFYTLDGADPRLEGGAISPEAQRVENQGLVLVAEGASARAFVPSDDGLGRSWTEIEFNDASWIAGTTGVGYERTSGFEDEIGLDVEADAFDQNESVYVRIPFSVEDPSGFSILTLRMKYDDGYAAYLNGRLVASRNAPDDLVWNAGATRGHSDGAALEFESVDVSAHIDALRPGENLLAIHGLNAGANSSDLLFVPELVAVGTAAGGISLERTTLVRARARVGETWSALNEATFVGDTSPLRVTELMFHPPAPQADSPFARDEFEFLELQNIGAKPLSAFGVELTGIRFRFSSPDPADDLAPGEVVLLVKNRAAFESRYGDDLSVAGEYDGNLGNAGDVVALTDAAGRLILEFAYRDDWYPAADGDGASLEIVDATSDPSEWSDSTAWRASGETLGTPGIAPTPAGGRQIPSDANQDANLDISDAVFLVQRLFVAGDDTVPCGDGTFEHTGNVALLDANGDDGVNIADVIYLLNYLFQSGPRPVRGVTCVPIAGCPEICP